MYLFIKTMALFWTFAEGLILVYVRWAYAHVTGNHNGQGGFAKVALLIFSFLALMMVGGETLLGQFADLHLGFNRLVYRWALWNFFCTLWVILEGAIMVYVWRIYRSLRGYGPGESLATGMERQDRFHFGIPLLIIGLFSIFLCYEWALIQVIHVHHIHPRQIYRISLFYIRICGVFWILFEWVVALIGLGTYRLVRKRGDTEK
jgi:hypothetical protein